MICLVWHYADMSPISVAYISNMSAVGQFLFNLILLRGHRPVGIFVEAHDFTRVACRFSNRLTNLWSNLIQF